MGKKLILKSNLVKASNMSLDQEELEKFAWKRSVIEDHIQTTLYAKKMLNESRELRKRLERSWDWIRKVTSVWSNYEDLFKVSIHNFSVRIDEFEKDQEESRIKEEENRLVEDKIKQVAIDEGLDQENNRKEIAFNLKKDHFTKSTKLSEMRKREKYIPDSTVYTFRVR